MVVKLASNELPCAESCSGSLALMRPCQTGEVSPRHLHFEGTGGRGRVGGGPGQGGKLETGIVVVVRGGR